MVDIETLKKIEGKHTAETLCETLGITRQSAINLVSKLKKEGYAKVSGGGRQKRIYTISTKLFPDKKYEGMFDILNRHSKEKIMPPFDHFPHTRYKVENAIIDLIEFDDIRILTNMLPLFNHVTDWKLLYNLSKKREVQRKIGALYDISRAFLKVRKMPLKIRKLLLKSKSKSDFQRSSKDFKDYEKIWLVKIPFNKKDLEAYKR